MEVPLEAVVFGLFWFESLIGEVVVLSVLLFGLFCCRFVEVLLSCLFVEHSLVIFVVGWVGVLESVVVEVVGVEESVVVVEGAEVEGSVVVVD